jgi:hypothetical protein
LFVAVHMVRTSEFGPGSSLGDYDIITPCGSGTYGYVVAQANFLIALRITNRAVYRAVHKSTRRVVALKKVAKFPMEDGV